MQRARRLASIALVATLSVSGLSACRAEPGVAAYLGDGKTITQERVESIYDEARADLAKSREQTQQQSGTSAATVPPVQVPFQQKDVLNALVSVKLLEQAGAAKSVQAAAEPTVEQVAQGGRLSPTWEYTKLYARSIQLRAALVKVTTAPLTDADLRPIYDRLRADSPTDWESFEDFKTKLQSSAANQQSLQQSIGLRNDLAKIIADDRITINPRYGNQQLILLSAQGRSGDLPLVEVSFTDASEKSFVTDVS